MGSSSGFHADTMSLLLSGLVLMLWMRSAIWSMVSPVVVGHALHIALYMGPSSPVSSAHSFQMFTPFASRVRLLVSPCKNQRSSSTMPFQNTFLVVMRGNASWRSNRICSPKRLFVPTPVRSVFVVPLVSMWWRVFSYVLFGKVFTLWFSSGFLLCVVG